MRNPWDPIVEMQAASRARRREMLRDLELMSRRQLLRRGGTLVAGASAASILFKAGIPLHASAQEETPPLPEYDEHSREPQGLGRGPRAVLGRHLPGRPARGLLHALPGAERDHGHRVGRTRSVQDQGDGRYRKRRAGRRPAGPLRHHPPREGGRLLGGDRLLPLRRRQHRRAPSLQVLRRHAPLCNRDRLPERRLPGGAPGPGRLLEPGDVPWTAHHRLGGWRSDAVPRIRPHRRRRLEGRGLPDRHRPRL